MMRMIMMRMMVMMKTMMVIIMMIMINHLMIEGKWKGEVDFEDRTIVALQCLA